MHQTVLVFLVLFSSFFTQFALLSAQDDGTPPNVLLIISDDQAWNDYSMMGHPVIETPHLDQLANQSVLFKRGYVPTALCRPSLMSIITGQYAHQHRISGNDPSSKGMTDQANQMKQRKQDLISFVDTIPTLPGELAKLDYLSFQSGKWWEGEYSRGRFTSGMTRGFPQQGGRHGDDGLKIGRQGIQPITDFVNDSIEQDKPFFLWYAPFLPHTPHNPPERLLAKYREKTDSPHIARYYAMCEWFDETCGELVELLEEKQIRENTLIIYVTDNGWIQKSDSGGFAARSKQSPHEGGVRTPIMFSWPDRIKPSVRDELCSSIDLFPTILGAVGLESDPDLPGLNLLPNLLDGSKIERDTIFGESFAHDIAEIENPEASLLYRWCIHDHWKLILSYDGQMNRHEKSHAGREMRPQLFDLRADPDEQNNLAAAQPELVAELVLKIDNWYPVTERNVLKTYEKE